MNITNVNDNQREEWNSLAAREPSFALLQSWEWGEFKEKLGWKVFRIAAVENGRIIAGVQLLIRPLSSKLFSIAYVPRGPIGNWVDEPISIPLLTELHRVARQNRAIYLKVEPPLCYNIEIDQNLQLHHFIRSPHTNQPRATIVVDLMPSIDDIFQHLRPTTRQRIKSSAGKGVIVRIGGLEDISTFYSIMKITSKRGHFPSRTREYYEQEWKSFASNKEVILLLAYYEEQLLAVHMASRFGNHAAYFHGGSIMDQVKVHPNHLLVWEAIKWAKEQGCHTFDLWGIPDEVGQAVSEGKVMPVTDRTDGLWGVYQFKSGFGKNVVYYMGAYDYVYNPMIYKMITSKYFNDAMIDRFSAMIDTFVRA